MAILITGSNGFVGRKAVDFFLKNTTLQILCLDIAHTQRLSHERVQYFDTDLLAADTVRDFIKEQHPRRILHLAGLSSVSQSMREPGRTLHINITSWINLLDAVRMANLSPRILLVSSSEVYGTPEPGKVVRDETHPANPETPYALSKSILEQLARQYGAMYGLKTVIARPFNHTGPGQSENFVLSSFAKRLMEIKLFGREPIIYTGNIEVERDFLDAADVIRAYHLLLDKGRSSEAYNICSGGALPLRWILEEMIKLSGVAAEIRNDLSLTRKFDIPVLTGSSAKLTAETGWKPEIPFSETLKNLLAYWENELIAAKAKSNP